MGRDGAEGTASEASAVHTHRVAYHLVGRYRLPPVAGMRHPGVGEVERGVDLLGGHGWPHGVDAYHLSVCLLPHHMPVHPVRLYLHIPEVLRLAPPVGQAFLVAVEHYVVLSRFFRGEKHRLGHIGDILHGDASVEKRGDLDHRCLSHAVDEHIRSRVHKNRGAQPVLPVVIVGHSPQRGLDAAGYYRHVGIYLLQDF